MDLKQLQQMSWGSFPGHEEILLDLWKRGQKISKYTTLVSKGMVKAASRKYGRSEYDITSHVNTVNWEVEPHGDGFFFHNNRIMETKEDWQIKFINEVSHSEESWDAALKEFLGQECHENRGERHPKAKLTERDIHIIRRAVTAGFPQKSIAKSFQVSQATISNVINNKQWKHVQ